MNTPMKLDDLVSQDHMKNRYCVSLELYQIDLCNLELKRILKKLCYPDFKPFYINPVWFIVVTYSLSNS